MINPYICIKGCKELLNKDSLILKIDSLDITIIKSEFISQSFPYKDEELFKRELQFVNNDIERIISILITHSVISDFNNPMAYSEYEIFSHLAKLKVTDKAIEKLKSISLKDNKTGLDVMWFSSIKEVVRNMKQ